jgi:hypothetical protein
MLLLIDSVSALIFQSAISGHAGSRSLALERRVFMSPRCCSILAGTHFDAPASEISYVNIMAFVSVIAISGAKYAANDPLGSSRGC